ncbi:response regulator [Paenibacillus endoradicis]|uniref:response regulator n=1 Tax=Paenibacillus endoradicis TaxID=2972487 RepID=UPI002158EC0D|nr:response regulator [Paenibacillus endoradicis]MCR8660206.1 response regulator [Paenibacillus endoradicis]
MFKLMLVEDEPIIREGLKYYFDWENLHFTKIIEAENGQEGIELALKERPDLIITDIRMPVMNGLDMIEQLRSQLPHSLFVILTGYSDFEYAKRAIKLGGITEYLLKPLQYDISLASIEKCSSLLLEQ